jgi:uncharacterized membrane protein YkoI
MKKRILVGMLVIGLMLSSLALFVGKNKVFAGGSTTPAQTTVTATAQANDVETADSNVQEPNYVGSIKVTDTNAKDEASETSALQGLAKVAQADAEASALVKVPGTVVKTSLDNENGYLVYSVTVKDAAGKMSDVKIDAGTCSVLAVEASDSAEERGTETKGEEASKGPDTDTVQEEVQSGN